jgi:2-oxoglutarate ferredoxin oxidoreductase subunit beta
MGVKREDVVFISGIGCSSRFPYYIDSYGMHSIHGRAPAIASGVKLANPDLSVWVITGDGDSLAIGGNHFIHVLRRNLDLNIILFNNEIYGLTKGQYSPTSEKGKITKSSPYGSIDYPFNPASLALGSNSTFVARTMDRDPKHLQFILKRAAEHNGVSFVEVYQNCNIFNNGTFFALTDKETKPETTIFLEHDKPMVFGKDNDKGIVLNGFDPTVVSLTDGKYSIENLIVHKEYDESPVRAFILAHMTDDPNLPTPFGIFRQVEKPSYNDALEEQIAEVTEAKGKGDLDTLLFSGNTWEVTDN